MHGRKRRVSTRAASQLKSQHSRTRSIRSLDRQGQGRPRNIVRPQELHKFWQHLHIHTWGSRIATTKPKRVRTRSAKSNYVGFLAAGIGWLCSGIRTSFMSLCLEPPNRPRQIIPIIIDVQHSVNFMTKAVGRVFEVIVK